MRYISFLDILGFGAFVETNQISTVIERIRHVLSEVVPIVRGMGRFPNDPRQYHATVTVQKLAIFSFSDTFVLYSEDDSPDSFFQIVAGTKLFCSHLMGCGLPVRGAITWGEAECIPGTSHLVGRAVVRAARLEKIQEWFGVLIDPEIMNDQRKGLLSTPLLKPIIVEYNVPIKKGSVLQNPCPVINWRFRLVVQNGTASLFPATSDPSQEEKRENTLAFCRWLRQNNLIDARIQNEKGEDLNLPWFGGLWMGDQLPGTSGKWQTDDC
jgi:hypothetical protein